MRNIIDIGLSIIVLNNIKTSSKCNHNLGIFIDCCSTVLINAYAGVSYSAS